MGKLQRENMAAVGKTTRFIDTKGSRLHSRQTWSSLDSKGRCEYYTK